MYLFIYDNFIRIKFNSEPVQFARKLVGNCILSPFLFSRKSSSFHDRSSE